MEIITYPNKVLRQRAEKITEFDAALRKLTQGMLKAMHEADGIGLAANQVGVAKRVIIVEIKPKTIANRAKKTGTNYASEFDKIVPTQILVNPVITFASKTKTAAKEGCLSIPSIEVPVARSVAVRVAAQNVSGKPISIKAKGLFARALQHEIDHINGVLIIDYLSKN
ncbi:peptide deformylase [Candidatus Berkelbacteria bacterium]|nr:peptide deformylase [Candidatus Berkelbacteria bacterium]